MNFYTSIDRYGSTLLYRGYKDGERVKKRIPFKPTMYVSSRQNNSGWSTLDGKPVDPIEFDTMREATEFSKRYQHVDNFKVHGQNNFISQFIAEEFPNDIEFDRDLPVITTIDIEVQSDQGFPEPDKADYPVTAICTKSNKEDFFRVWGLGDYTQEEGRVIYTKCDTELQLLDQFLTYWQHHGAPDSSLVGTLSSSTFPILLTEPERLSVKSLPNVTLRGVFCLVVPSVVRWV